MARFTEIPSTNNLDALGEVLHEDIVQEIPESGGRVQGLNNVRAIFAGCCLAIFSSRIVLNTITHHKDPSG